MTDIQVQVVTALLFAAISCTISLVTWLGLDRQSTGPKLWAGSFLLYTLVIVLALAGLGQGLYSPYQLPSLAILAIANWLQYKGFRSYLNPAAPSSRRHPWSTVAVIVFGASCSALSFIIRSPLVTFAIESSLGVALTVALLLTYQRRRRPFNQHLSWFIQSVLGLFLLVSLVATGWMLHSTMAGGLYGVPPSGPLTFGPQKWLVSLILLALIENLLVSGVLLEAKDRALRDSEAARLEADKLNTELQAVQRDILDTMAVVFEKRTVETAAHVERVAILTEKLLTELQYSPARAQFVGNAARLHDIGKIGISDEILHSSGLLAEAEQERMKQHAVYGYQILSRLNTAFFQMAARIAVEHHERWDGSGYPNGLRAKQICLEARVVAIIDTFDALTSRRSYKPAWDLQTSLDWIAAQSGLMFDPELVAAFLRLPLDSLPPEAPGAL